MAKIKRKVALGPKAFLMHLLKKEETTVELDGYTSDGEIFSFDPEVTANEFVSYNPNNNTYTVEIEEEIKEETVIFRLLEVRNAIPSKKTEWQDLKLLKSYLYGNHSISEVKNEHSVAIYILNDDMTMTLVWKDGKLVD